MFSLMFLKITYSRLYIGYSALNEAIAHKFSKLKQLQLATGRLASYLKTSMSKHPTCELLLILESRFCFII